MNSLQIVCIICQFPEHLCDLTSQENKEIAKKLTDVTTIQIEANDSLPRCICYVCIGTLNVVYDFLQQCREAEQRLQEKVHWETMKNHEGLEIRISSIKKEPLDMMEDEQLLYGIIPDNYATEQDLSEGEIDLGDDRKDIVLEEFKLAEPMTAESGCRKGSELQQHLRTHSKDRLQLRDISFSCQSCQKSYMTRNSLKRHVKRTHMGKKVFDCYRCEKAFPQQAALEEHVHCCRVSLAEPKRKPSRGAKLKCTFCEKSNFPDRWKLKRHLRTHTKEQPYECNECHRKFSRSEHLKRHQLIHSDEKPHKCDLCKIAFRKWIHLKRHKISHSVGEKSYECVVCRKAFRNRTNLNIHMRLHEDSTSQQQRSVPKLVGTGCLTIKEESVSE